MLYMKDCCTASNIVFYCLREDSKAKLIDGKHIDDEIDRLESDVLWKKCKTEFFSILKLVEICKLISLTLNYIPFLCATAST